MTEKKQNSLFEQWLEADLYATQIFNEKEDEESAEYLNATAKAEEHLAQLLLPAGTIDGALEKLRVAAEFEGFSEDADSAATIPGKAVIGAIEDLEKVLKVTQKRAGVFGAFRCLGRGRNLSPFKNSIDCAVARKIKPSRNLASSKSHHT